MNNSFLIGAFFNGVGTLLDKYIKNNKIHLDAHNEGLRIKTDAANKALITLTGLVGTVAVEIIRKNINNGKIPSYYAIARDKSGKILEKIPLQANKIKRIGK